MIYIYIYKYKYIFITRAFNMHDNNQG